jgi:hypothetical protein
MPRLRALPTGFIPRACRRQRRNRLQARRGCTRSSTTVIARKIDERAGNDLTDRFPLIGPRGVSQGLSFWARLLGFAKEWAPRVGTGAPVCGECAVQACADLNADQARAQFLKKRILEKYAAPLT